MLPSVVVLLILRAHLSSLHQGLADEGVMAQLVRQGQVARRLWVTFGQDYGYQELPKRGRRGSRVAAAAAVEGALA